LDIQHIKINFSKIEPIRYH